MRENRQFTRKPNVFSPPPRVYITVLWGAVADTKSKNNHSWDMQNLTVWEQDTVYCDLWYTFSSKKQLAIDGALLWICLPNYKGLIVPISWFTIKLQ